MLMLSSSGWTFRYGHSFSETLLFLFHLSTLHNQPIIHLYSKFLISNQEFKIIPENGIFISIQNCRFK
ncbi:hypothetical protein GYH30_018661 [Glycine max]|uniref:Uncharacterized protein n=1 Tax=Glycine max TaxID=3847 RepID=K7L278_SOYBN|nr:hypothetical protein GYH30_018661 [Glycine max]